MSFIPDNWPCAYNMDTVSNGSDVEFSVLIGRSDTGQFENETVIEEIIKVGDVSKNNTELKQNFMAKSTGCKKVENDHNYRTKNKNNEDYDENENWGEDYSCEY